VDILRIFEILSFTTTLIGLYLLGEKKALGFLVFTGSLVCQMYIFYEESLWFLFCQMIALIIFNVVNYRKWIRGI
jgi:hypothetical protein